MYPSQPEQNQMPTPEALPNPPRLDKTLSTIGMIFAVLFPVAGVIIASVAYRKAKKQGVKDSLALTGIWVGGALLFLQFVFVLFLMVSAVVSIGNVLPSGFTSLTGDKEAIQKTVPGIQQKVDDLGLQYRSTVSVYAANCEWTCYTGVEIMITPPAVTAQEANGGNVTVSYPAEDLRNLLEGVLPLMRSEDNLYVTSDINYIEGCTVERDTVNIRSEPADCSVMVEFETAAEQLGLNDTAIGDVSLGYELIVYGSKIDDVLREIAR